MKKFKKNQGGQAVTEFAIVLPALILLIVGGLVLGIAVYNQVVVVTAANQGARLGAALSADEDIPMHVAASRAKNSTESALSTTTGQCNPASAGPSANGQSFEVDVTCQYALPIPFMNTSPLTLQHRASYHIFE
ncbi:TadE/TadG family type IV pilus assembly protein [Alteribacter populi]|uniref:TadE/TadG family type IV pilus assembly protein n=1 Tax=Alteribacter populi TaxID=2011011 RepID=UPI0012FE5B68|nr:TadE/TadG family type IV pilus assembly protein [Alteribacter populi]